MPLKTEAFHLERAMLEFIEKEIKSQLKTYQVYAEVDGRMVEVDHGESDICHIDKKIVLKLRTPFTYY